MDKNNFELLARLEAVLTNEKSIITQQTIGQTGLTKKAERLIKNKRTEKTHLLELDLVTHKLTWRNMRGKQWQHAFTSHEQANAWWQNIILPRAVSTN